MSSTYSTFCQTPNNQMAEPMFFGQKEFGVSLTLEKKSIIRSIIPLNRLKEELTLFLYYFKGYKKVVL